MKPINKKGFALLEFIIIFIVITVIVATGIFLLNKESNPGIANENSSVSNQANVATTEKKESKIKHLGIDLGYYDAQTNKAGDFEFTKDHLEFGRLFFEYGYVVPANSEGPEKSNPQPTFILPLGTKVHSMVDGEVFDVPKLYSGDYSVMVKGEGSDLIFETEHVINTLVKKGDKVKAGDIIAEVSDYDSKNYSGMGLVEIGILQGGNPPFHLCPFNYLDDSIKDETLKRISEFQKSWESYIGDSSIYDEQESAIPGCLTNNPIEG